MTNDHMVPRKRLVVELMRLQDLSDDFILPILELSRNCLITKADDEDLNRAGLRQDMPHPWKLGDDMWARYHKVGICFMKNPLLPNQLNKRVIR